MPEAVRARPRVAVPVADILALLAVGAVDGLESPRVVLGLRLCVAAVLELFSAARRIRIPARSPI